MLAYGIAQGQYPNQASADPATGFSAMARRPREWVVGARRPPPGRDGIAADDFRRGRRYPPRVTDAAKSPGAWRAFVAAMTSLRTAAVALQSFSSGLPLGLVLLAVPDWMNAIGVDIRVVGLITLAQAPWSFKVVWAPLMDRWTPPWLGRRRGWILLAQVALMALTLALAGVGSRPETPWIVGAYALAIALASATQDIAVDAYAVEVLEKDEQGTAVGARTAFYRAAMLVAGNFSIWLAARWSWPAVLAGLAVLYLPTMLVTLRSPEPEHRPSPPHPARGGVAAVPGVPVAPPGAGDPRLRRLLQARRQSGRGIGEPVPPADGLRRHRAGILARLDSMGSIVGGTFVGGALTDTIGLGRALWIFGLLQILSNLGYVFLAQTGVNLPLMYGAVGFEAFTTGLGTGAFSSFSCAYPERFSATQYALFSSCSGFRGSWPARSAASWWTRSAGRRSSS